VPPSFNIAFKNKMKLQKSATSAFSTVVKTDAGLAVESIDDSDLSPKSKDDLHKALANLQREKHRLEVKVKQLLPRYGEVAIDENIQEIERILERAMNEVHQRQLDSLGSQIWRQAMSDLRGYLAQYKVALQTGESARAFNEAKEGVQQINVMMRRLKQPAQGGRQGGRQGRGLLLGSSVGNSTDFSERVTCCICQDCLVDVSMKCGHLLCSTCSQSVDNCPLCRKVVKPEDIRPVYF
jgi:hypothetical protein